MDNLVERLLECGCEVCKGATDRIEALEKERDALVKAIRSAHLALMWTGEDWEHNAKRAADILEAALTAFRGEEK